jgi:hypothetical protein
MRMNAKLLSMASAGLLFAAVMPGYAQSPAQEKAPGQQMQDQGSKPGQPGASGYAPGQQMQDQGSKPGQPGASGFAPGRQNQDTTGRGGMGDKEAPKSR